MADGDDDLHVLSVLLVKDRPPEYAEKVREILASDLSLREKIQKIDALDSQRESEEAPPSSSGYLSRPKPSEQSGIPEKKRDLCIIDSISSEAAEEVHGNLHTIQQNRKILKNPVNRSSFFSYFFRERKKIRKFALESGVLGFRAIGTVPVLNTSVLEKFQRDIRETAKSLTRTLKPILEEGWLYLGKRDYNLVSLLYRLCREATAADFKSFSGKSSNHIDKIINLETLFLIFHYEREDIRELHFAVDTVFNKDPSLKEIQKETSVNLYKLLDRDHMRPSLYNMILGLNILKSRTFLELQDLRKPGLRLLDTHDFDCTPKVRDRIDEHLRKLEKGMRPYLEQEAELLRMQAFIPTDGRGNVDDSILADFYNKALSSRKLNFETNKENIIKLILNLGYAFLSVFRNILSETIKVDTGEEIRLFAQPVFGQDMLRLEYNLGKLDRLQTKLPKLASSRYLFIRKSVAGAIEAEAAAVRIIDELTSTLVFMGKRIAHILRNASPEDHGSDSEISYFSFDEKSYLIPRENQKILSDEYLRGKTVKEALYETAAVCYQTGTLVQHSEITELLEKEKNIRDEIRNRSEQYRRIAHEIVYRAFAEKYNV